MDCMIDIETMGTGPDAAVISIGACAFDRNDPGKIAAEYYCAISLQSNQDEGRSIDAGTVEFWLKQSKEAQQAFLDATRGSLRASLIHFRGWIQKHAPALTHVWGNDPDFDVVILRSAFAAVKQNWPFPFWMSRSVRTIGELAFPCIDRRQEVMAGFRKEGTHHNAKDDAIAQALFVQCCYSQLKLGVS